MAGIFSRFLRIIHVKNPTIPHVKNVRFRNFHLSSVRCKNGKIRKFEENILYSDMADVEIPANLTIEEFVFSNVEKWANHIALECPITKRTLSYHQLQTKYNNLNKNLRKKLKLEKGNIVALMLPNCGAFSIAIFGVLKAGLVVTTINPGYRADEISRQLQDSKPKALITLVELTPVVEQALNLTKMQIPILAIKNLEDLPIPENILDFNEFLVDCDYPDLIQKPDSTDVALMPYSSGTTGLPKGVELTHYNIIANLCQIQGIEYCRRTDSTSDQEAIAAVLPKYHLYGLVANIFYLHYVGAKVVDLPKFQPDLYLSVLKEYRVPVLYVAPPLVLFLINYPGAKSEHLQFIRTVISGAAPLSAQDEDRFIEKARKHVNMSQVYGLTETSPFATSTRIDLKRRIPSCVGSIGRPIPNTQMKVVKIDDGTSASVDFSPLGRNIEGELLIKGPQVMKGYYNKASATKATFTPDGEWFRTGDLVKYNEDDLVFVTDRLKELIKVKGYQVAPAELEALIRNHPDVADVAVIGIPHKQYGEVPRAYVVPKNKGRHRFNAKHLEKFIEDKVTDYKQLKGGVEIIDTIPKNPSGKILRRELRDLYAQGQKENK